MKYDNRVEGWGNGRKYLIKETDWGQHNMWNRYKMSNERGGEALKNIFITICVLFGIVLLMFAFK